MIYEFDLPMPPSINGYRACVRNRLITSKRGREYFVAVQKAMDELKLSGEMIEQPVMIHLTIHPRTRAKFDCSNYLKAYEDALVKCGFLEDDHWIEYSGIKKAEVIKGGLLRVRISL